MIEQHMKSHAYMHTYICELVYTSAGQRAICGVAFSRSRGSLYASEKQGQAWSQHASAAWPEMFSSRIGRPGKRVPSKKVRDVSKAICGYPSFRLTICDHAFP